LGLSMIDTTALVSRCSAVNALLNSMMFSSC